MKTWVLAVLAVAVVCGSLAFASPIPELVSTEAQAIVPQLPNDPLLGSFQITFDLTALDQDLRLGPTASYSVWRNGAVASCPTSTLLTTLDGTAPAQDPFLVREGVTRRFEFRAIVTPSASGIYQLRLNGLEWQATNENTWSYLSLGDTFHTGALALLPEPTSLVLLALASPFFRRR